MVKVFIHLYCAAILFNHSGCFRLIIAVKAVGGPMDGLRTSTVTWALSLQNLYQPGPVIIISMQSRVMVCRAIGVGVDGAGGPMPPGLSTIVWQQNNYGCWNWCRELGPPLTAVRSVDYAPAKSARNHRTYNSLRIGGLDNTLFGFLWRQEKRSK